MDSVLEIPLNFKEKTLRIVKKGDKTFFETNWGLENKPSELVKKELSRNDNIIWGRGIGRDCYTVRINLSEKEDNVHLDEGRECRGSGMYATAMIDVQRIIEFLQ